MSNKTLLSVALASIVSGCASFSAGDLPAHDALEDHPRMPPVSYELRTFGGSFMNVPGPVEARVEPLFRRAFREIHAPGDDETDLHLDLLLRRTTRHPGLTIGLGLCFISTLGLFPAYGQEDLYLDVRVLRDGQTLGQYIYTEEVETWYHLVLLPWSFKNDPEDVGARILDSMVLRFLEDLRRDLPRLSSGAEG